MDTNNDNIRRLFDMLDNPAAYSEQEIRDIINFDEETRETYRLMVEAKRSSRWKQSRQSPDVDAAWQRFVQKYYPLQSGRYRMRIAASFIGILIISALAFAAYRVFTPAKELQPAEEANCQLSTVNCQLSTPVRFEEVRLDSILTVVSSYYGKAVRFRDEELRGMKLITTWNPADSLSAFIEHLNMFDYLHMTLQEDTIFVESANDEEDE